MQVLYLTSQGVLAPAFTYQKPFLTVTKGKLRLQEVNLLAQGSKWQRLDSNPGLWTRHYSF